MPIIDITIIQASQVPLRPTLASELADALGSAIGAAAGGLWVRLHVLPATQYAENACCVGQAELPVFATVLHARPPTGDALRTEMAVLTSSIAQVTGRAPDRVHVEYAPPGGGRMAFGGRLIE